MEKAASYPDFLAKKFNALELDFYGMPVVFTDEIIKSGVQKICTEREQHVFSLRCDGRYLQEIADDIGVSRERVRQILCKIERKLKGLWTRYYPISIAEADQIIRRELNHRTAEMIKENSEKKVPKHGYSFQDFAAEAGLSVRTFNCIARADIETVEELICYTPDEIMKLRNFGRKSFDELDNALKKVGLSFSDKVQEKPVKPVTVKPPIDRRPYMMDREKMDFLKTLSSAYRISVTSHMREVFLNFDPFEYGVKEENREIQSAWHECVLMRNVSLMIRDMLLGNANEKDLIRVIKYAFVASRAITYGLDYEHAEDVLGISKLYLKYFNKTI